MVSKGRGFTLIELLVVMAILGLLLSLAAPRYFGSVEAARETTLAENLRITRTALDQYFADRGRYPDSLNELVTRRYLRALPVDPIASSPQSTGSWAFVAPPGGIEGRIADIRSRAPGVGRNGRPYAQW